MSRQAHRIHALCKLPDGAKKDRLMAELRFAHQMSLCQGGGALTI